MVRENETSLSLLEGIRENDAANWDRFSELYTPLIYEWCRRAGVPAHDAPDLIQEVFQAVATGISKFQRNTASDSFHGWLYGITRFKVLDYFRARRKHAVSTGGTTAQLQLNNYPDVSDEFPESADPQTLQNAQQVIYERVLKMLQTDFQPKTWGAFWQVTVEDRNPADVAADLQMSVGAVYNARYKVLNRLKTEFAHLIQG